MTKLLFTLLVLILTIGLFAENYDTTRQRLDPNEFSIMPWGGNWSTETNMDTYFQNMYDCGFNLTNFINAKDVKYAKMHN